MVIDVKDGRLTLNVGDEKRTFSFSKTMKMPMMDEIRRIYTLGDGLEEFRPMVEVQDPLHSIVTEGVVGESEEARGYQMILDRTPAHITTEFEVLHLEGKEERTEPPPKVELTLLFLNMLFLMIMRLIPLRYCQLQAR